MRAQSFDFGLIVCPLLPFCVLVQGHWSRGYLTLHSIQHSCVFRNFHPSRKWMGPKNRSLWYFSLGAQNFLPPPLLPPLKISRKAEVPGLHPSVSTPLAGVSVSYVIRFYFIKQQKDDEMAKRREVFLKAQLKRQEMERKKRAAREEEIEKQREERRYFKLTLLHLWGCTVSEKCTITLPCCNFTAGLIFSVFPLGGTFIIKRWKNNKLEISNGSNRYLVLPLNISVRNILGAYPKFENHCFVAYQRLGEEVGSIIMYIV